MSFVVDTDICSAHLKDHAAVTKRFLQYTGGLYISTVTLAELYAWVYRAPDSTKRLEALDRLLSDALSSCWTSRSPNDTGESAPT